ncbi:hypothetical protein HDU87_001673 [Geranomyces variabilis]|uniref:Fibronectin type-III domain-containing protein n=1 Tax=Geranomyces variabilis TaxID=109894 RepID=A0AAD5TDD2_9FUNG|nr:hypothetical protein HDU87_001673 [Geranomyces variabilis]
MSFSSGTVPSASTTNHWPTWTNAYQLVASTAGTAAFAFVATVDCGNVAWVQTCTMNSITFKEAYNIWGTLGASATIYLQTQVQVAGYPSGSASNSDWTTVATASFSHPSPLAWSQSFAASILSSASLLLELSNLTWTASQILDPVTISRSYGVTCTQLGGNPAQGWQGITFTSNELSLHAALPSDMSLAVCNISGTAVVVNSITTLANTLTFGILKRAPVVKSQPTIPTYPDQFWIDASHLSASWIGSLQGDTEVLAALRSSTPSLAGLLKDSSSVSLVDMTYGIVQYTATVMLSIATTAPTYDGSLFSPFCTSDLRATNCSLSTTPFNTTTYSGILNDPALLNAFTACQLVRAKYSCANCFNCIFRVQVIGTDIAGAASTTISLPAYFDGTDPVISSFVYPADKGTFNGLRFFAKVQDVHFQTTVLDPEAALTSIRVDIAVSGYTGTVQNIFGTIPFTGKASLTDGTLAVDASTWNGISFHNQAYDVILLANSAAGRATQTAPVQVLIDATPPSILSITFNQTFADPAHQTNITATLNGLVDLESGVRSVFYKWGPNVCDNMTTDFSFPLPQGSAWQTLDARLDANGLPFPTQTLQLELNAAQPYKSMRLAVVAINNAAGYGVDITNSRSLLCSSQLPIDSTAPIISVNVPTLADWFILNGTVVSGAIVRIFSGSWSVVDVELDTDYFNVSASLGAETRVAPFTYDQQATFSFLGSAPVSSDTTLQLTLKRNDANGTVYIVDWSNCVSTTISVDHYRYWLVSPAHGFGETPLVLPGNATQATFSQADVSLRGTFLVCISAFDVDGTSVQAFCSQSVVLDETPPVPSGGVRNLDPLTGQETPLVTDFTQLSVAWDPWTDKESQVLSYTVNILANGTNCATISSMVVSAGPAAECSATFTGLTLNVSTVYTASIFATNSAGLSSAPLKSKGASTFNNTALNQPYLQILDGISVNLQGVPSRLFSPTPSGYIHVIWGGFVSPVTDPQVVYEIVLKNGSLPVATSFVKGLDALIPVPAIGSYSLSVNIDGQIGQLVKASETIIVAAPRSISAGIGGGACSVAVQAASTFGVAATITAAWPQFVDSAGLLTLQQVGFRVLTGGRLFDSDFAAANSTVVSLTANVTFRHGQPSSLNPWSNVYCVVQAIDALNNTVEYTLTANTAMPPPAPVVVSLPISTLNLNPANATDFAYFQDTPVTISSAFCTAFFGFPMLAHAGVSLASVNYSVGTTLNNITGVYDDIEASQPLDLSGATFQVSNYTMTIAGSPQIVYAVALGDFGQAENTPVYVCVQVVVLATTASSVACSAGTAWAYAAPTAGTVTIAANSAGFSGNYSSLSVYWTAFTASSWYLDSAINSVAWAIGTYAGGDDVMRFTSAALSQTDAVATNLKLMAGEQYYATIIAAIDGNGLTASAVSDSVVIDWTAPTWQGLISVQTDAAADESWTVTVAFSRFDDPESGIASLDWTIETYLGFEDKLPTIAVDTPISASASGMYLAEETSYIVRIGATNSAGLRNEIITTFTVAQPAKILSLTDAVAAGDQGYSPLNSSYSFSWQTSVAPATLQYAVGSRNLQDNLVEWTTIPGTQTSVTVTIPGAFEDGITVIGSLRAFNRQGVPLDEARANGITFDASPPWPARVSAGADHIHSVFVGSAYSVSISWANFVDPHSGIVDYLFCVDDNDSIAPDSTCSNLQWTKSTGATVVVAHLQYPFISGQKYYAKVQAVNGVQLSVIGVSPAFLVDLTPPIAGVVTFSHPSSDTFQVLRTLDDGSLLYLDRTSLQVDYPAFSDPESGISSYEVAVVDTEGFEEVPFASTSVSARWILLEKDGLNLTDGRSYNVVVRATNGAGRTSQVKSATFMVDSAPPMAGKIDFSFDSSGTGVQVWWSDFYDLVSGIASYRVDIGTSPRAGDVYSNQAIQGTSTNISSVGLAAGQFYHVTVWALDRGNLLSTAVTTSAWLPSVQAKAAPISPDGKMWNIDSASPNSLDFSTSNQIIFKGPGLVNLVNPSAEPNFQCVFTRSSGVWTSPPVPLLFDTLGSDYSASISCSTPLWETGEETISVTVQGLYAGLNTSNVLILRNQAVQSWPQDASVTVGLELGVSFVASTTIWGLRWPALDAASYFEIRSYNDLLLTAPGSSTSALFTLPVGSTQQELVGLSTYNFTLCPFFGNTAAKCINADNVFFSSAGATINPDANSGFEYGMPTLVRIVGTGSSASHPYESVQFQSHTDLIAADWSNSFVFSEAPLHHYDVWAGYSPFQAASGLIETNIRTTSTSFSAPLLPGLPFYVTIAVWTENGVAVIYTSAPLIADDTPPTGGAVWFGNSTDTVSPLFQSDTMVSGFWRAFVEPESIISRFEALIYDASNTAVMTVYDGLAPKFTANVPALQHGSSYRLGVRAQNGAGLWSATAFSASVTIDRTPPVAGIIQFGDGATSSSRLTSLALGFTDPESQIVKVVVQIGTVAGGDQLLRRTVLVGQSLISLDGINLVHNTTLYANVTAVNGAGLTTTAWPTPVRIDLTAPLVVSPITVAVIPAGTDLFGRTRWNFTATWSDVFVDWETGVVSYISQVSAGTLDDPGHYINNTNTTDASLALFVSENQAVYVTVRMVFAMHTPFRSDFDSFEKTLSAGVRAPPIVSLELLDGQLQPVTNSQSVIFLSSTRVNLKVVGAGLVGDGMTTEVAVNSSSKGLSQWSQVQARDFLKVVCSEAQGVAQVLVRVTNKANMSTVASSPPFQVLVSAPPADVVSLEWKNSTSFTQNTTSDLLSSSWGLTSNHTWPKTSHQLMIEIVQQQSLAPSVSLQYSLGVFSSASSSTYDIYGPVDVAFPPGGGPARIPISPPPTAGVDLTAVLQIVNPVGMRTVVQQTLYG